MFRNHLTGPCRASQHTFPAANSFLSWHQQLKLEISQSFLGYQPGQAGVFVEPVGRVESTPAVRVSWHGPAATETLDTLRRRLLTEHPAFGLTLGHRQLGTRTPPDPSKPSKQTWILAGTPPSWSDDYVRDLISSQSSISDLEILRRQVRKKSCTWWFRGLSSEASVAFQVVVGDDASASSFWALPYHTRPAHRPPGTPISTSRPFTFRGRREAFPIVEKPAGPPPAELGEPSDTEPRPNPEPKKPAATIRVRQPPDGTHLVTVPGDGSCFFHAVLRGLQAQQHGLDLTAQALRAQTIAHMRKYSDQYIEHWDGCDDHGQGLHSFNDYLTRMQSSQAWAGFLELTACCRTHRLTAIILSERVDIPPCVINDKGGLPRVVLWHSADHFDLLLPTGDTLPASVLGISEPATASSLPRAGASSAPSLALASSAPTTLKRRRAKSPAPPPSTLTCHDLPPDVEDAPVAPVRREAYGNSGRFRLVRSWSCPLCSFTTGISAQWNDRKLAHIAAWHPQHRGSLAERTPPEVQLPPPGEEVRWQCPLCPLAILASQGVSYDQARAMRLRHREQAHPLAARDLFLVQVPASVSRANAAKATQAVRAAAASRRLLARKGTPTTHDLVVVTLPWFTKPTTKRRTCVRHLCRRCGLFGERASALEENPCEVLTASRGPHRQRLLPLFRKLRAEPALDSSLAAGLDLVLATWERLGSLPPPAPTAHTIDCLAWPGVGVRYICTTCALVRTKPCHRPCRGRILWNNRRKKRHAELQELATSGPAHHRPAALRLLQALGFSAPSGAASGSGALSP